MYLATGEDERVPEAAGADDAGAPSAVVAELNELGDMDAGKLISLDLAISRLSSKLERRSSQVLILEKQGAWQPQAVEHLGGCDVP